MIRVQSVKIKRSYGNHEAGNMAATIGTPADTTHKTRSEKTYYLATENLDRLNGLLGSAGSLKLHKT